MTLTATKSADFVISRVLDAPRDLVWKCFTDAGHMGKWWGPKGFTGFSSKMDFRVGGRYHYGLKSSDGMVIWGRMIFREIVPPEKIVYVSSFSDEQGGQSRHPMAPDWPMEMLSIFTFEEQPGGKTRFTVRFSAYNATADEQKVFDDNHGSMNQGWSGTLDRLEDYLPKAEAA